MPRLIRGLSVAEPVDQFGTSTGPAVTLHGGSEFTVSVPKLKRTSVSFDLFWCEIRVADRL